MRARWRTIALLVAIGACALGVRVWFATSRHTGLDSDEAIVGLNIPNGIPLVYELDDDLRPLRSFYLGDAQAIAASAAAVADQGKG